MCQQMQRVITYAYPQPAQPAYTDQYIENFNPFVRREFYFFTGFWFIVVVFKQRWDVQKAVLYAFISLSQKTHTSNQSFLLKEMPLLWSYGISLSFPHNIISGKMLWLPQVVHLFASCLMGCGSVKCQGTLLGSIHDITSGKVCKFSPLFHPCVRWWTEFFVFV